VISVCKAPPKITPPANDPSSLFYNPPPGNKNRAPPASVPITITPSSGSVPVLTALAASKESNSEEEPLSAIDINEIKRDVKRISNRRALVIASRLSGNNQDTGLKNSEKMVTRTEAEIARLRSIKLKNPAEKVSSILIENGAMMMMDSLRQKLENLRNDTKEDVFVICN
jgi:hypothetical protein